MKSSIRIVACGALATALALAPPWCVPVASAQIDAKLPSPEELLEKMVRDFSPTIPSDVDPGLQKRFTVARKFPQVQLLFDIDSWESFVALCWPADKAGKPLPKVNSKSEQVIFDFYPTSPDIFDPAPSATARAGAPRQNRRYTEQLKLPDVHPGDRVLAVLSSVGGELNSPGAGILKVKNEELAQAFAQPLWDQHGMMVRYEILVNDDERTYILQNGLETVAGQVTFTQAGKAVKFPSGVYGKPGVGAVEVKLGWKVLDPTDDESRFLSANATILTGNPQKPKRVKVGLIGMHIAHKTETSPQWIWSTFSHVDAVNADALTTNAKTGQPLAPLFTNPGQETIPVNIPSATTAPYRDGLPPTQVLQVTPIPLATQQVNRKAQEALKRDGSVLQYYELLNTQWPIEPSSPPATPGPGTAPGSINNKPGGRPTPVYLVNPLFETYFQKGNQPAGAEEEGSSPDQIPVFGTESCMGCHSSAGVAIQGGSSPAYSGQLTGDFSWLLQTKAQ